ncbi:hypothetical protein KUTeg_002599 [Tegillarca granosa]|uniref:Uncharacterized protein n=1 Tax=Tegillarca granosa TaxID=220873 RepID=A0ABQ9FYC3_TEGGR|nr:hypothetical protein KUTeg_002599 [Tegillarca granosa]
MPYHAVRIKGQNNSTSQKSSRIFLVIIAILVVIVVALIIALAVVASKHDQTQSEASMLSESMDPSVNPCDDFFEFVCGTWNKKHVIAEDKSSNGVFSVIEDDVNIIIKNILEKRDKSDIEAVRKTKDYYHSCINEEQIENLTVSAAHPFLKDLGGWPVLENQPGGYWNSSSISLEDLLVQIRQYSNSPPVMDMFVYDDFKNPTEYVLFIDQSQRFGMPERSYFLKSRDDKTLLAYQTYATKTAVVFGASPETAKIHMKEMVDFEIQLANEVNFNFQISMAAQDRRDEEKLYNPTTIRELKEKHKEFNWLYYFQTAINYADPSIKLTLDEKVIVRNPDYINKLFEILKNTPKRVVSNYVIWRALLWLIEALPESIRILTQHYKHELLGTSSIPPRWKYCSSKVNKYLGMAVGKIFINEAFDPSSKANALEMIEDLRETMKELIDNLDWMNTATKDVAKEKADFIEPRIGYPDEILDDNKINEKYKTLHIDPGRFFDNFVNNLKFKAFENLAKLRKPVDRSEWDSPPATVNAYYNPIRNQIIFPAGVLQPPIYHANYPHYMNYGGIGYVIGHEITHGFDDTGRLYDKNGNLHQWWDKSSIENFKQKANCTIQQYSAFTVKEANKNINGKLTLGENIADNGGIKESFKVWCGNVRPKEALRRILADNHSHYRYRVIGSMQNSEDFAKVFNCPSGSYMNPKKKCQIW